MIKTQTTTKRDIPKVTPKVTPQEDISHKVAESAQRFYAYQYPRETKAVELNDGELPSRYDTTQVTLLARDPHYIHAYWDIAPDAHDQMRQQVGAEYDRSTYTLRMYDITKKEFNGHNANSSFDVAIQPHQNNWYVNLWGDNVNYCGEIGVKTPQGQFYPIARSNVVHTPRASISERSDMMWMDVKENRQDAFIYTWSRANRISNAIDKAGTQWPVQTKPGRKIYLSEDDIRAYYSSLFPLLSKIRKRRNGNGATANDIKDIGKYSHRELIEDISIPGISKSEYYRRYRLGDSAELVERGGGSEQNFVGASESVHQLPQRKFFFEIWTELIVYGRTEPDAKVYLDQKNIPLRKDGTFTLRYALPDGRIPFNFAAISHDQIDRRTIKTAVERSQTKYGS